MYSTSQIAALFGLHPNTIRLYEDLGFISSPERKQNGYRVFTDEHAKQIEIVRIALRAEVLQNGLRKQAIKIIQSVAERDIKKALRYVDEYIENIEREIQFSTEAVRVVKAILSDIPLESKKVLLTRKQTADHLHITIDTLRNWELNGLIEIKRKENGYRAYDETDLAILTVIRELRTANYSLSSILRMLNALRRNQNIDVEKVLNTPEDGEFIISVCDKLKASLFSVKKDAVLLRRKISSLSE